MYWKDCHCQPTKWSAPCGGPDRENIAKCTALQKLYTGPRIISILLKDLTDVWKTSKLTLGMLAVDTDLGLRCCLQRQWNKSEHALTCCRNIYAVQWDTQCGLNEWVYSALMLARHVSDLTGPSSGAFCTSCIRRLWYVVLLCVLLDTSSRYKVLPTTS